MGIMYSDLRASIRSALEGINPVVLHVQNFVPAFSLLLTPGTFKWTVYNPNCKKQALY